MLLYHGSKDIIEKPIFGGGKAYNDYGRGFYCTESLDLAKEWAVARERSGFANSYELDTEGLTILDLNDEQYCILHWLAMLLENREFNTPSALALEAKRYIMETFWTNYQVVDAIIGYRADDSYFSFAQDFINGTISYQQLGRAMHLGKLGQQFVLKSPEAFERIHFIGYEDAPYEDWFNKKMERDTQARREYLDIERNKRKKGDLFITAILDEEMKADDERLR